MGVGIPKNTAVQAIYIMDFEWFVVLFPFEHFTIRHDNDWRLMGAVMPQIFKNHNGRYKLSLPDPLNLRKDLFILIHLEFHLI